MAVQNKSINLRLTMKRAELEQSINPEIPSYPAAAGMPQATFPGQDILRALELTLPTADTEGVRPALTCIQLETGTRADTVQNELANTNAAIETAKADADAAIDEHRRAEQTAKELISIAKQQDADHENNPDYPNYPDNYDYQAWHKATTAENKQFTAAAKATSAQVHLDGLITKAAHLTDESIRLAAQPETLTIRLNSADGFRLTTLEYPSPGSKQPTPFTSLLTPAEIRAIITAAETNRCAPITIGKGTAANMAFPDCHKLRNNPERLQPAVQIDTDDLLHAAKNPITGPDGKKRKTLTKDGIIRLEHTGRFWTLSQNLEITDPDNPNENMDYTLAQHLACSPDLRNNHPNQDSMRLALNGKWLLDLANAIGKHKRIILSLPMNPSDDENAPNRYNPERAVTFTLPGIGYELTAMPMFVQWSDDA